MAKFNTTVKTPKTLTTNLAGGEAYSESKELALVSLLLTSFVNDQFYRTAQQGLDELRTLLDQVNPEFASKACIYTRDKFNMRSISHALAAELAKYISGKEFAKSFYDKIIVRPDDMTEILAYYYNNCGKKIPNSLKKGFSKAFNRFNSYSLAKYKGENKDIKLVDIVNLIHPIPTEENKEALNSLINGVLKNTDTWEAKLSKAGQESGSEEELTQIKSDAWKGLISTKKIGLMALIRNLRNIINQSPECVDMVCELLLNENYITKSRVLPFRFSIVILILEKY